jgi:hypothetical protein
MAAIEITVSIEELRKKKIFIATPKYGGQCGGQYCKSTADLAALAANYGMDVRFFYLFNESLITRARNYLVDEFLRSDCTHLMFIDSDIGFDPNDVIALAVIAEEGSDKHIVCGPYPKKCIAWEKIKRAVDKGFADKDPHNLERYVGDYVFNPKEGTGTIALDEPVEVLEGGTGFMMIQRKHIRNTTTSPITFARSISMDRARFLWLSKPKLILSQNDICQKTIGSVRSRGRLVLRLGSAPG